MVGHWKAGAEWWGEAEVSKQGVGKPASQAVFLSYRGARRESFSGSEKGRVLLKPWGRRSL